MQPETWGAMGRTLAVRLDNVGDVVMLGPALRAIAASCPDARIAALVARARLLVANNAGPMQLADAVRCPMVVLFSGSDLEEQWRPRQALAALLRRPTPCDPCYRVECPFHMECLDIPARDVVRACEEVLARTAHRLPAASPPLRRGRRTAARTAPGAAATRSVSLGSEGAEP